MGLTEKDILTHKAFFKAGKLKALEDLLVWCCQNHYNEDKLENYLMELIEKIKKEEE